MQQASVTRLYKDRASHEAVMLLEAKDTKERFRVTLPVSKAGILALEGHGLNDRCAVYRVLSECVAALGGSFRSVIVTLDEVNGVSGAMSLSRNEEIISCINADVVELVAFALHVQLPIYVHRRDANDPEDSTSHPAATSLPAVFEDVLSEILNSDDDASSTRQG